MKTAKHLILYDAHCQLCLNSIKFIKRHDKHHRFNYAALDSNASHAHLTGKNAYLKKEDTLILLENVKTKKTKVWIRSKGIFRIFWILGGPWKFLGALGYLPFGGDVIYRFIAHHRKKN
jgi:predicted DCC family thiol-disulfide oxidoreductase YuxK